MDSHQEGVVKSLCEKSIGGNFVFEPNKYRFKKHREREPADIAWACNNCILLGYMTAGKSNRVGQIKHNLDQAKGWMKQWKQGVPLRGQNNSYNFEIAHNLYRHTILLSIIECGDDSAEFHFEEATALEVDLCVTISQSAFDYFVGIGAGLADLLEIIRRIEAHKTPLDGLSLMKGYFNEAVLFAKEHNKVEIDVKSAFNYSMKLLISVRSISNSSELKVDANYVLTTAYNDLFLKDFYKLVLRLSILLSEYSELIKANELIEAKKTPIGMTEMTLNNYNYIIAIFPVQGNFPDIMKEIIRKKEDLVLKNSKVGTCILLLSTVGGMFSPMLLEAKSVNSNCELILQKALTI